MAASFWGAPLSGGGGAGRSTSTLLRECFINHSVKRKAVVILFLPFTIRLLAVPVETTEIGVVIAQGALTSSLGKGCSKAEMIDAMLVLEHTSIMWTIW